VHGECRTFCRDKRVISLDLDRWLAGAKYRGEFEGTGAEGVLKEIEESNGQIILFIDELHTISAGGGGGGN